MSSIFKGIIANEAKDWDGAAYDRWLDKDDPANSPSRRKAEKDPEDLADPASYHDEEPTYSLKNLAKADYSKDEGTAPNGKRYNMSVTYNGEPHKVSQAIRNFKDQEWGAKAVVDVVQDSPNQATLYAVDNHKYGTWKPWKDQDSTSQPLKISNENAQNEDRMDPASAYQQAREITRQIKYDQTVSDILVQIHMLAEKSGIPEQALEYAVDEVHSASAALESAIYGLDEVFKEAVNNGLDEDSDMRYAAEKTPAINPYGGDRDRQFRGAISEISSNKNISKEVAKLLEGVLYEYSTAMNLISSPSGTKVLKHLLQQRMISHDQPFTQIDKVSLADLKATKEGDAYVLFQGDMGAAVMQYKASHRMYYVYYTSVNDPEINNVSFDKGTEAMNVVRANIGTIRKIYVGKTSELAGSSDMVVKRGVRANRLRGKDRIGVSGITSQDAAERLYMKFKPLFNRAIASAIADMKGVATNMIKHGAYVKAKDKIKNIHALEKIQNDLEFASPKDHDTTLSKVISKSLKMTAHYYYPEETGLTSRYHSLDVENRKGLDHLISDIASGDTKKLAAVIAFFKRNLIA